MIKYRRARKGDITELVKLTDDFRKTLTEYNANTTEYDPEHVAVIIDTVIDAGIAQVAEEDGKIVALLLMVLAPSPFNRSVVIASELCFYVDPEHRRGGVGTRLLKNGFNIAKQLGCDHFNMIHMITGGERASPLYEKYGFEPKEVIYSKEI